MLLLIYLIGFIITFCCYIYLIKKENGYVISRDILNAITISISSWIFIIAVLIVYLLLWLEDNVNWKKRLF